MSNKIGAEMTAGTALFTPIAMLQLSGKLEREKKRWIGSGLCMNCFHAKEKKELAEQELIKEAQLRQARDIIETPSTWDCPYCKAINRGNFCQNCGSPRKKQEIGINTFNPKAKLAKESLICSKCSKLLNKEELSRNDGVCDDCWDVAKMREDGLT